MRKLLITFLLLTSFQYSQAANIGGLDIDLKFCRDFDKWSGILSSYSNVQFPIKGGAVGITTGLMQNTSIVTDFCQYLMQMAGVDTQGQIWKTLEFGNKMSDNQYNDELNYMQSVWSFTNQVIDLESGKGRKGALESASTHRRLNRLIKQTGDMHDKYNPEDPLDIQSKREAEGDMNRLARLSYKRALIKEATNCPKPATNKDYSDLYEKEVAPQEEYIERDEVYVDFYRQALLSMGPKFLMKSQFNDYMDAVNSLTSKSSAYKVKVKTKKEKTVKMQLKDNVEDIKPTESKTEEKESEISTKYQTFSVTENTSHLKSFIKEYDKPWGTWIKAKALRTRGLLRQSEKGGFNSYNEDKVENEFKDFSILCNRGKIAQSISRTTDDYYDKVRIAYEECKENSSKKISKAGGLLRYYAKELVSKSKKIKTYKANIWTFESYYLGSFRSIGSSSSKDRLGEFSQEEVQCAPITNLAVMNKLSLKQQAVNTELNQMIVEQMFKQNNLREKELIRAKKEEAEERRRQNVQEEITRRKDVEYHKYIDVPPPKATSF